MQFLAARTLCTLSSCGGPPGPAQRPPAPAPRRSSIAVAMRAAMSGGGVPALGAHGTAALLADPAGGLMAHHLIDDPVARLAGSGWSLVGSDGAGRVIPAAPAMRPTWSVLSPDTVRARRGPGRRPPTGSGAGRPAPPGRGCGPGPRRPWPGRRSRPRRVGEQPAPADDDQVASGQGQLVQQVGGDDHRPALGGQAPKGTGPNRCLGVEAVQRLVEDDRGGVAEQGGGDAQALAHAERAATGPPAHHLGHPGAGDPAPRARRARGRACR
jgi:hypothetical protein